MPVVGEFARGGSNAGALEDAVARERSGDRRPAGPMAKRCERRASNAGGSLSLTDDSLLASLSSPALPSVRVDYTNRRGGPPRRFLAEIDGIQAPTYKSCPPTLESRASTAATTSMKI